MKKNTMMRIASFLLIAVLLTTSTISGTYAKYVTQATATDTARVAKWGVEVSADGTLFSDAYYNAPMNYVENEAQSNITVQADTQGTKIVAPGTENATGMTFKLTGTPEVDTKVEIAVTTNDICLPAGPYPDFTTDDSNDTFTLNSDYYPVVFTLRNGAGSELAKGNLKTIETYLNALSKSRWETNSDLSKIGTNTDGTYKLTWEWAFDGTQTLNGTEFDATLVDKADTYLGNVIANVVTNNTVKTDISFDIKITVTQVD